jgi:hypothetical protein
MSFGRASNPLFPQAMRGSRVENISDSPGAAANPCNRAKSLPPSCACCAPAVSGRPLRKPLHHHDPQPPAGRMGKTFERRAHSRGHPRPVPASRPSHRHYRQELSGQGGPCGEPGKQEATQAQRTFDRETGKLNGSLSGSARFTSLLTHYGKRLIFTANESY